MLGANPKDTNNVAHMGSTHGADFFTNVVLTNQNGQHVKFYDDLIIIKFVVINMMYAQCSEAICPISTYNLRQVQKALDDRVGRDI